MLVVVLLMTGAGYQQWSQAWVRAKHPPPGELIEVAGKSMHIYCTGEGDVTVVLEAGATGFAQAWTWIQQSLSKHNRVCSYDRVGMGWSEGGEAQHTGLAAAKNLRLLLEKAGEQGPFVVVGHSMGGPLAQIFTGLYPDEVIGVALIDPSHPDQMNRYGDVAHALLEDFAQTLRVASWLSFTGVLHFTDALSKHAQGLPQEALASAHAFASSHKHLVTSYLELEHWNTTMSAARQYMDMGDRPLLVVSAAKERSDFPREYVERFQRLHAELANMSSEARYVRMKDADHFTVLTEQKFATQTAELIQALVERAHEERWKYQKRQEQGALMAAQEAQSYSPR